MTAEEVSADTSGKDCDLNPFLNTDESQKALLLDFFNFHDVLATKVKENLCRSRRLTSENSNYGFCQRR